MCDCRMRESGQFNPYSGPPRAKRTFSEEARAERYLFWIRVHIPLMPHL